ncbi:trimethylamine methyltransferase family protein [Rubellimicrobium roseum]|uniref:trimethylamine methyltransferase family protein n=1 Tax=Rubellimicrobium roseum TaxID=687525 RepID=UPI00248255BE|nr:trimethylamine methyltransferase family protein [Rubellimicrobium roseum]
MRELTSTLPSTFIYRARNPERSPPSASRHPMFVQMIGAPFLRDLNDVRRWPTMADLHMFHKLAHINPALHSTAHHIVKSMHLKASHLHITHPS